MHYLLGLEVWQGDGEIFLGKGKYTTEIPMRFHMKDCKPMTMPLATNYRKVDDNIAEQVDDTFYRKLINLSLRECQDYPHYFHLYNCSLSKIVSNFIKNPNPFSTILVHFGSYFFAHLGSYFLAHLLLNLCTQFLFS